MPKYSAETVEKAIITGLSTLQIAKEDATIEVIQEGKKGFLGFGKQKAIVVVEKVQTAELIANEVINSEIVEDDVEQALEEDISSTTELVDLTDDEAITALTVYLTNITRDLGAPSIVKISRDKGVITFNLETEKKGLLIGKHGKLLNAIQYLSQVYIHRIAKNRLSIVVNVGDYRERRKAIIERLARQTLRKVRETGQPVFLEPMPAFERKQVHSILSSESDISTHSEGNEPHRYLVVELKD